MNLIIFHNGAEGCGELIDGADGNACPATLDWIGVYYGSFYIIDYDSTLYYFIIFSGFCIYLESIC